MSKETIFFSYSRDNTEFVLNLAKSLRNAGAHIWLDQLDIKPGTRWDSSIEKALEASQTLLVILSNKSVASHNVMDEVSYALGENKKVVPVLLEECDIPFRLKRLQYADFTSDHQKGLKTLAEALNLNQEVAEKLRETAPAGGVVNEKKVPAETEKPAEKTPIRAKAEQAPIQDEKKHQAKKIKKESQSRPYVSSTVSSTRPKSKVPLYLGGALVLLLIILWLSGVFDSTEEMTVPQSTEDFVISEPADDVDDAYEETESEEASNANPLEATTKDENKSILTEPQNTPVQTPIQKKTIMESPRVNGQNVSVVQYTDGQTDPAGYFRQVDQDIWEEESIIHDHVTPFEEVDRDEWSVYLLDRSRDMTIQLDLNTRQVILNQGTPDGGVLYTISQFESTQ